MHHNVNLMHETQYTGHKHSQYSCFTSQLLKAWQSWTVTYWQSCTVIVGRAHQYIRRSACLLLKSCTGDITVSVAIMPWDLRKICLHLFDWCLAVHLDQVQMSDPPFREGCAPITDHVLAMCIERCTAGASTSLAATRMIGKKGLTLELTQGIGYISVLVHTFRSTHIIKIVCWPTQVFQMWRLVSSSNFELSEEFQGIWLWNWIQLGPSINRCAQVCWQLAHQEIIWQGFCMLISWVYFRGARCLISIHFPVYYSSCTVHVTILLVHRYYIFWWCCDGVAVTPRSSAAG